MRAFRAYEYKVATFISTTEDKGLDDFESNFRVKFFNNAGTEEVNISMLELSKRTKL